MANREVSDAAEHETFPGPGPLRADEAKRGIHPVEQMVDAAIDRIAREQQAARDEGRRDGSVQHALALASTESASTSLAAAAAAASASTGSARRANARLRWKGLDVSDEFRSYADRVARGEDLPPFKGKILAEPGAEFPWDPKAQRRAEGRALKRQFGLWSGVALFLGLSVWVLVVQVGKQPDASRAAESAVSTAVLSNQPVVAPSAVEPNSLVPKAELAVAEPQPTVQAQPEVPAAPEAAATGAVGTTALASLQEPGKAPVSASGARAGAPATGADVPAGTAAAARPSAAAATTAAGVNHGTAAAPADVFVATRSTSAEAPAPSGNVGTVRAAPSTGNAVPAALGQAATVATGAATTAPAAAAPGVADTAAGAHADPKKEPGREASAMGPLLVETPSF